MTHTDYATIARYRKAERLADVLETFNSTATDAETLATEGRRKAEQLAMVRVASDTTWALVVEILRSRSRARAVVATMTADDVFAKLEGDSR